MGERQEGGAVSAIDSRVRSTVSGRDAFDLATIVAAGVVSTVFFLAPVLTPLDRPAGSAVSTAPQVGAAGDVVITAAIPTSPVGAAAGTQTVGSTPQPRPAIRTAYAPGLKPAFVHLQTDSKPSRSRLARFLLGDGTEPVRPFPLARQRSER
jgi:hypothetical protein